MTRAGARSDAMFRIKICGVTSVGDAALAAGSGADAVGVNFYPGSRRYVPAGSAAAIVRAVRDGGATPVGVFVNERPEVVEAVCRDLGIGVVQLSGDEPPEEAARLPFRRIKAIRIAGGIEAGVLAAYPCEAFLLDAGGRASSAERGAPSTGRRSRGPRFPRRGCLRGG